MALIKGSNGYFIDCDISEDKQAVIYIADEYGEQIVGMYSKEQLDEIIIMLTNLKEKF